MANTPIDQFDKEGVVVPLNLRCGLFTSGAVDNVDVNPSSATAISAFHGTATSISQHVNDNNLVITREVPHVLSTEKRLKKLPENYTYIKPVYVPSSVPMPDSLFPPSANIVDNIK